MQYLKFFHTTVGEAFSGHLQSLSFRLCSTKWLEQKKKSYSSSHLHRTVLCVSVIFFPCIFVFKSRHLLTPWAKLLKKNLPFYIFRTASKNIDFFKEISPAHYKPLFSLQIWNLHYLSTVLFLTYTIYQPSWF